MNDRMNFKSIGEAATMRAFKTTLLAWGILFLFAAQGSAQQVHNIVCNKITLSWTCDGQFAVINAYNGCPEAPMYVAVCITFKDGRKQALQTVGPVPYGQTKPITIGLPKDISERAPVRWAAWSLIPSDPCR